MLVEVWADVVCPFCYIGRARLRRAIADSGADDVVLVHRAFELDPTREPVAGAPVLDMLAGRYGLTPEQADAAEDQVAAMAAGEGLPHAPGRRMGGTLHAHRLLALASDLGLAEALLDELYAAYFGRGEPVFAPDDLLPLALAAGLPEARAREVLGSDAYVDRVRQDERTAHELGATGVPFTVVEQRVGVSGAQQVRVFAEALARARALSSASD